MKEKGINYYLVADAGRTQVEPGSLTVLGIGPEYEEILNSVTGHLKLLWLIEYKKWNVW